MQKFEGLFYHSGDFRCAAASSPACLFALHCNETELVRLGCTVPGDFSEETALTDKARLHRSGDGLTASLELTRTIPFGSEPEIRHVLDFSSAGVHWATDFSPKGQPFRSMRLEPVVFGTAWREAKVLLLQKGKLTEFCFAHDAEGKVLLQGADLIVWCDVHFANGCRAGFGCGNDLWRHGAALSMPGAAADFRLTAAEDGTLRLERTVFVFPKEAEVDLRPWRFKNVLFFAGEEAPQSAGKRLVPEWMTAVSGSAGVCLASAPARRQLRELLRRALQEDTVLELPAPRLCLDAGHLERAGHGELAHWDVEEFWELYCHFGRKSAERGRNLTICCGTDAPASMRCALACPMKKLIWEEEK